MVKIKNCVDHYAQCIISYTHIVISDNFRTSLCNGCCCRCMCIRCVNYAQYDYEFVVINEYASIGKRSICRWCMQ